MNIVNIIVVLLSFSLNIFSQTVDEIKNDKQKYLWGEGKGVSIGSADKEALKSLISQISVQVESSAEYEKTEENGKYNDSFNSVVNTYSKATLNNTERIIISNEPDAYVFRYIKKSEIRKVFNQRKNKILEFVESAQKAKANLQIADALRYYYWSMLLLKSHPYAGEIYFTDEDNTEHLLKPWLSVLMNDVFSNIHFSVNKVETKENFKLVILDIYYKNKPISNFDYSYWDGKDWSSITSAKDGKGIMEFGGVSKAIENVKIKAEYLFEGEARIDKELEDVMENVEPIMFRKSYYQLQLNNNQKRKINNNEIKNEDSISEIKNKDQFQSVLDKIFQAIETRQYSLVKNMFTNNAYDEYTKLLTYGNARIVEKGNLKFYKINDEIFARSAIMSFSFKNNKKFVEKVCFTFNNDNKISNLSFALSDKALNDILSKDYWSEINKFTIIKFLENYKTAYALKRIDYIESIFDDNALIIVGNNVRKINASDNNYINNTIVEYNKYSKQEYINKLRHSFSSKEYINLKFEDSSIRTSSKSDSIFGIQIKQYYYSSNYGDIGYLFLLVDLSDTKKPLIHVRTWQPNKADDGTIYGIGDF